MTCECDCHHNATRGCWCECREEITAQGDEPIIFWEDLPVANAEVVVAALVEVLCGESAFADLGSEIHRFRCANPDCRHLSIPRHFTPRDNDAASACFQWLRGVLAALDVAPPHREGPVMSENRYRQHQIGVRLSDDEHTQLAANADAGGTSPAELLRRAYFRSGRDRIARVLYEANGHAWYGRDLGAWGDPESRIGRNEFERDRWLLQADRIIAPPAVDHNTAECATCSGRGVWMDEPCGDCAGGVS